MNYNALKCIHLVGLALTFMGLTGILTLRLAGQGKLPGRLLFHVSHGVGLLLIIVSGFMMAAQLGIVQQPPGWLNGKMVIWLLAAASTYSRRASASMPARFTCSSSR
jgi:uncharacterized membrane protein SirB2